MQDEPCLLQVQIVYIGGAAVVWESCYSTEERERPHLTLGFKTGGSFIARSPNFKIYI